MYNMSKIKYRKLILQYAYLKLEKEEIDEVCLTVEKEMRSYLEEHYPDEYDSFFDSPKKQPASNAPEPEEEKPAAPKNKDLKKLYRKIAEKTHPDKTGNNQHAGTFSRAALAYEKNDIAALLEIAGNLNIELMKLSAESVLLLENNIKTISKEIHSKKSTVAWAWSQAKTKEDKDSLINVVIENRRNIS